MDKKDFKAIVEIFKNCYKTIEIVIKQFKKAKKTQVTKFFEVACLQKVLVYNIYNNHIPRIDLKNTNIYGIFIALNSSIQKCKQSKDEDLGFFSDIILLVETFSQSINILAQVLIAFYSSHNFQTSGLKLAHAQNLNTTLLLSDLG